MSDDSLPKDFAGTVRLFPLPNVVLFPHAVQALHIFEPRYRQMMADTLVSDRLMAPALLSPGWEKEGDACPAIHAVVCIGKVIADQKLDDGRYNLLLRGVARATIIEEIPTDRAYRTARVELLQDGPPPSAPIDRRLRRQIEEVSLPWFQKHPSALEQFQKLLSGDTPLATLCDLLSFAMPLLVETKQRLLAEVDVSRRSELLVAALKELAPGREASDPRRFPPDFSSN